MRGERGEQVLNVGLFGWEIEGFDGEVGKRPGEEAFQCLLRLLVLVLLVQAFECLLHLHLRLLANEVVEHVVGLQQ